MSQILQATEPNVSLDHRLLADNEKVVVTQREFAKIAKGGVPSLLTNLGPGLLMTAPVTMSGVTAPAVVASITPGFRGRIVSAFALVSTAASTASKAVDVDVAVEQSPGTNETQTLTLTGVPTGGDFTITFPGMTLNDGTVIAEETSGAIAWNAASAAAQTALLAMTAFNAGDVTVTGGVALPTGPHTITFAGRYAGQNVPLFVNVAGNTTSLTGGTAEAAAVVAGTAGVDPDAAGPVNVSEIVLTTAIATPAGKVVPGSLVNDGSGVTDNEFTDTSVITFRARDITAFSEGVLAFGVVVAPVAKPGPVQY